MHYFLKPLLRAMHHMNERELLLSIILGFVLAIAGLLDLLRRAI
jgi:Kef-type K+ transport system membrane component KefB